jgi:hypothetical protein
MVLAFGGVMSVALSYKINAFNKMLTPKDYQQASLLSCIRSAFSQPDPLKTCDLSKNLAFLRLFA